MIDLTLRCFSRARWLQVATNRGILDADGNPNPGFMVDEIGLLGLPPQYDDQGVEIYPAFQDTWYWINLRIVGKRFELDVDDDVHPEEKLAIAAKEVELAAIAEAEPIKQIEGEIIDLKGEVITTVEATTTRDVKADAYLEVTKGVKFVRSKTARWIRDNGIVVELPFRGKIVRAFQIGTGTQRVQIFDPRTYAEVKVREYYGGYSA